MHNEIEKNNAWQYPKTSLKWVDYGDAKIKRCTQNAEVGLPAGCIARQLAKRRQSCVGKDYRISWIALHMLFNEIKLSKAGVPASTYLNQYTAKQLATHLSLGLCANQACSADLGLLRPTLRWFWASPWPFAQVQEYLYS